MTGFGFCGPMTAMGTVFDDKDEAAAPESVTGYPAWQSAVMTSMWLLCVLGRTAK